MSREYDSLRGVINNLNISSPEALCRDHSGSCCERMIPVTAEDMSLIEQGVLKGSINPSVFETAVKRSSSFSEESCVFLVDKGCSLNEDDRPLMCRAWNLGGINQVYDDRQTLTMADVRMYACDGCQLSSIQNNRLFNRRDNNYVEMAVQYVYRMTVGNLPEMVSSLSQKLGNLSK